MRKAIIAIVVIVLPLMAQAQSEGLFAKKKMHSTKADQTTYAKPGAVPCVDGKVVFAETMAVAGKDKEAIYNNLAQWAGFRYEPNSVQGMYTDADFFKNLEYSRVTKADKQTGELICQGAEELIFSIKTLAKNYTQVFYTLHLNVTDGVVKMTIDNISYNVDQGEGRFERVAAEDWITDQECLNKKGELRRIPGKYRIKTIDLVDELKKEVLNAAISSK